MNSKRGRKATVEIEGRSISGFSGKAGIYDVCTEHCGLDSNTAGRKGQSWEWKLVSKMLAAGTCKWLPPT